ncbi:MAG: hypothetical protein AAGH15_06870 [Myxococcota bacterium]
MQFFTRARRSDVGPGPFALAIVLAVGCATDGSGPTSGFDGDDVVSVSGTRTTGTRVLADLAELAALEVEDDLLILELEPGTPVDVLPQVGDVLVSDVRPEAPYGFARNVLAVSDLGGDRYELETQQATLTEIFESLDVALETTPNTDAWEEPADPDLVGRAVSPLDVENRIELFPQAGTERFRCGNGGGEAELTAIFELAPELYTEVAIRPITGPIDAIRNGILERARLGMGGQLEIGFQGRIRGEAGLRCTSTFRGTPIERRTTIYPGGVPTIITHVFTPQVEVLVTLGAAVEWASRTTTVFAFEAGVEKPSETEDWRFFTSSGVTEVNPPAVPEGRVELRVQVEPSVEYTTLLYDAVGPAVGLGIPFDARLGVALEPDACPTFDLTAALQASVGAEVRVPVISRPRARVSQTFVLFGPASVFGGPLELCPEGDMPGDPADPPGGCAALGDACVACITAGCGWCAEGCVDLRDAGGRLTSCEDGEISTTLYRECPSDPCSGATSCTECGAMEGCGWCGETGGAGAGTCLSEERSGECGRDVGHWRDGEGACTDCTALTDCTSCADDVNCGWCEGTGCVSTSRDIFGACGEDGPRPVTLPTSCEDFVSVDERCQGYAACGECTRDLECFWCSESNGCDSVRRLEAGASACRGVGATVIDPNACETCEFTDCRSCATNGFCQWCDGECQNASTETCEGTPAVNPGQCG